MIRKESAVMPLHPQLSVKKKKKKSFKNQAIALPLGLSVARQLPPTVAALGRKSSSAFGCLLGKITCKTTPSSHI